MIELVIIFLLLIANGVLAMAEIAVVSARRARLIQLAENGAHGARDALLLSESPTQFFSTVQIGITLIGIFAGAFGGAALAAPLAEWLMYVPALAPYASQIALFIVVVIITFFSLLIGELVPKRLALASPERLATVLAPSMRTMARVTSPLVRVMTLSTDAVTKLLRVPATNEQTITEEEIKIMLDEGAARGVFATAESELVGRVFRLGDLSVNALMTPRPEIAAFDIGDSAEQLLKKLAQHNHSRFPVVRGSMDQVLGIVKTKDLLAQLLAGRTVDLEAVMQPALFVPEGMAALDLLDKFKAERTHVALVTDEYGGIEGIITINDLAEALVSEVALSNDESAVEIIARADGSYLVDGKMAIHAFKQALNIKELPQETARAYQTVGGFVMMMLGRVPKAGDHFEWSDWRVEVMDMDGRRVDKILVMRVKQ